MDEVVPRDDRHPEPVGLPAVVLGHEGELVAARLALLEVQNKILSHSKGTLDNFN